MRYLIVLLALVAFVACSSDKAPSGPTVIQTCESGKSNDTAIGVIRCPDDHSTSAAPVVPSVPE